MQFFSLRRLYCYILVFGVMKVLVKCAPSKRDTSWDTSEEPKLDDIYLTVASESEERDVSSAPGDERAALTVAPDEFILTTAHNIVNFDEDSYLTEETTPSESSSVTLSWAELFQILQKRAFLPEVKTSHKKEHFGDKSISSTEALDEIQTIVDNLLKYNRKTGEQLKKLKNALFKSSHSRKKFPRIKIKINAQAPLKIKAVNEKNTHSKGMSVIEKEGNSLNGQAVIKKYKLENQETITGPSLEQETEGEIERVRKLFIKKGANFLRLAWNRYLSQKLKHSQQNEELENEEENFIYK